jgi:hypothetical protein
MQKFYTYCNITLQANQINPLVSWKKFCVSADVHIFGTQSPHLYEIIPRVKTDLNWLSEWVSEWLTDWLTTRLSN